MAAIELALARPPRIPDGATWDSLPNGQYVVTNTDQVEGLDLPSYQFGKLEKYSWSATGGVAYFFPRGGGVRVWARSFTSTGWGAWAS